MSWTLVPLPRAMRLRRLPLMRLRLVALLRGHRLDDRLDAHAARRSSTLSPFICLPTPGIILSMSSSGPIFLICSSWERKSSKVNSSRRRRSAMRAASWTSTDSCARSTSVSTSPMPRMREAMRSGWKSSSASAFSPTPTNLIGTPVTCTTESAAPPRASPSILVRTTPVKAMRLANVSARFTASWPVSPSSTRSVSWGLTSDLICGEFLHERFVDVKAAGGVEDDEVEVALSRFRDALLADADGVLARAG